MSEEDEIIRLLKRIPYEEMRSKLLDLPPMYWGYPDLFLKKNNWTMAEFTKRLNNENNFLR